MNKIKKLKEKMTGTSEEVTVSHHEDLDDSTAARLRDIVRLAEVERQDPELYGSEKEDSYTKGLKELKHKMGIPTDSKVIYPGSNTHTGVALVFGADNVTHVDPDEAVCRVLGRAGYSAEPSTIEDFQPVELADGIVTFNSYGTPTEEVLARTVKPGGFIITNNYTHWANTLNDEVDSAELTTALLPDCGSNNRVVYEGGQIPTNATGITDTYYRLSKGVMSPGTPEENDFVDQSPNYPDALFVFEYNPS